MRQLTVALTALLISLSALAGELPIFDAHVHYSNDAWDSVSVEQVIQAMRQAGVKRALLSSSGHDGQLRLYTTAPRLFVPELTPYRRRGETGVWMRDESVIPYVEAHLQRHRYAGIGEFHLHGADADLPVPRRLVQLAKQHDLFLHAHADADAVERLFAQWPQARIIWAHAGFAPPPQVGTMLRKHPALYCDLSLRSEIAADGNIDPAWRALFLEFPDRFMLGSDPYTPERWRYAVGEHARWARAWLPHLPPDVAERIAWKNGETLFGAFLRARDGRAN
jgi:hypothetical protein